MAKEDVKFTRKELKEDELVTFSTKALTWLEKNRKPVLISLILMIAVIIIYYSTSAFIRYRAEKASDEYIEAVEALVKKAEQNDRFEPPLPPSDQEIKSSIERLERIYEKYRFTGVGKISLLRMAQLYYALKDYEMSQKYAQDFLMKIDSSDPLYLSTNLLLANLHFAKKDFEGVLTTCNRVLNSNSDFLKDEALYLSARALINLNKNEEAKNKLKELVDKYQNSHLKNEAREIIKSL